MMFVTLPKHHLYEKSINVFFPHNSCYFFGERNRLTSNNTTDFDTITLPLNVISLLYICYLYLSITIILQNDKLDISLPLIFVI